MLLLDIRNLSTKIIDNFEFLNMIQFQIIESSALTIVCYIYNKSIFVN